MSTPVGRFAPSPSGPLHAGSLVAALGSWLDARARGGRWLVRIEDVDTQRRVPGADARILQQLEACGLRSDEPVWWQSQRGEAYARALDMLLRAGTAYPCSCSRRDLQRAGAPLGPGGERIYPGTCRTGSRGPARAWRLRVPSGDAACVRWHCARLGEQRECVDRLVGDFVLRRADGDWAYQLAVVVDDAAQQVSDVVRGEDLAGSTARQILLQRVLGLPTPRYLHLPLLRDAQGRKLSKSEHAEGVVPGASALRDAAAVLGLQVHGATVGEVLESALRAWPELRARWESGRQHRALTGGAWAEGTRAVDTGGA
ncbi:tRNA glutamyl-Q(34) synthetase GluQRS [Thiomonas sp.]|uniref:tRNA glutamyl-Q(34) synthetase GluQRS n=1 Tax=Thiomonas sp. TaxID=2047785 RepID=UPI002620C469|nr:tRNA glutamyl-Q(34) synthetase GluQRS [Thiomonas sp.]